MKKLLLATACISVFTFTPAMADNDKGFPDCVAEGDLTTFMDTGPNCHAETPTPDGTLPDAMMGSWSSHDSDGLLIRGDPEDFVVEKDGYSAEDLDCKILQVEKQTENLYTVQARCTHNGGDAPSDTVTNEFELVGKDKLLVTPAGS